MNRGVLPSRLSGPRAAARCIELPLSAAKAIDLFAGRGLVHDAELRFRAPPLGCNVAHIGRTIDEIDVGVPFCEEERTIGCGHADEGMARGIANRVEEFGNLVSVWSTYESRHAADDPKPFVRGINSLQIVKAQGRYWVASIIWDDERSGISLPEKYLK